MPTVEYNVNTNPNNPNEKKKKKNASPESNDFGGMSNGNN